MSNDMDTNQVGVSIGYLNLQLPGYPEGQTAMIRYDQFVSKLFKQESFKEMALHAALGACGEAGELGDAIKRHVTYGKPVDRDNIVEELGDLRFFMQAVMNLYQISETEVLQANGYKLAKRYPTMGYRKEDAIARADKANEIKPGLYRYQDSQGNWYYTNTPEPGREEQ